MGSEMCIRDRAAPARRLHRSVTPLRPVPQCFAPMQARVRVLQQRQGLSTGLASSVRARVQTAFEKKRNGVQVRDAWPPASLDSPCSHRKPGACRHAAAATTLAAVLPAVLATALTLAAVLPAALAATVACF